MKRKSVLIVAALFFLLFLGLSWFGFNNVVLRFHVAGMETQFGAANAALSHGQRQAAGRDYQGALQSWQLSRKYSGYYPRISGAYLIAGNCFQQLRQPRAALKCYEEGLLNNPVSISILTTLGGCAFRLGEYDKAFAALQKSRLVYPLKRESRLVWKKLQKKNRSNKPCVK